MKDIQKIKEFFSKPLEEGTTEYFKPSIRKDKSNPNFIYVDITYPAGSDVLSVGGSKTMGGQDREEGAAKALSMGNNVAKKLEAKYNIDSDDIEVKDLKNGKVQVFAISDKFIKMASPSLDEAEEEETAVDMAKKQLDALGIKYEMSGNKFKPFKAIYKPSNEDLDALYDQEYELTRIYQNDKSEENWKKLSQIREKGKQLEKFDEIIYLFNLGSAVKQAMNESLTAGYPYRKTSGENFEKIVIVEPIDDATKNKMIRNFRAEGWDAKPNFGGGITAIKKTSMEEAKFMSGLLSGKDFINAKLKNYPKAVAKVNQLIDMIGEDKFTIEMAEWIFDFFNNAHFESPINENTKSNPEVDKLLKIINTKKGGPEYKKALMDLIAMAEKKSGKTVNTKKEALLALDYVEPTIREAKEEDKVDTITMDIPLFLRMLEYSREDASQDMDLHDVTEKANVLGKEKGVLSMEDYDAIVGAAEEIEEGFYGRGDKRRGLQNQSKLSSAEYQMAKKLKSFKASDWKWNADEDLYNKVTETTDYMKHRQAQDDYAVNKKDKPKKSSNPNPSGKTDYMKRREKELAETILAKLKK
jgi:hypothetical protein